MVIWFLFEFSSVIENADELEILEVFESIFIDVAIHVVFEEVQANDLVLNVASNSVPELHARVAHIPVVLKLPVFSLSLFVKIFQGFGLLLGGSIH